MKVHLTPKLLFALVSALPLITYTTQVSASTVLDWENATDLSALEASRFFHISNSYIRPSTGYISVDDIQFLSRNDGIVSGHPADAKWVNYQALYLNELGGDIVGAGGEMLGLPLLTSTSKDILHTDNGGHTTTIEAGALLIGTRLDTDISRVALSDYTQFTSEQDSEIRMAGFGLQSLEIIGGHINKSKGNATDKASSSILLEGGATLGRVIGANLIDATATANTQFTGDTTIIVRNAGSYSESTSIVGANSIENGVTHSANYSGNVKISLQDTNSTAVSITGGIDNQSATASSFGGEEGVTSSVTIKVHENAFVGTVVGGNSGNAGNFTGNTNISIDSTLSKTSLIVGANSLNIPGNTTFTGDTNILITATTEDHHYVYGDLFSPFDRSSPYIVGGFASGNGVGYSVYDGSISAPRYNYEGTSAILTGSTNVTINLTDEVGTDFDSLIVGGSVAGAGQTLTHTGGGANLTITGAGNVTFNKIVVAGNISSDTTAAYKDRFPHIDRINLADVSIDQVSVKVDSGDFSSYSDDSSNAYTFDEYGYGKFFIMGSLSAGGGDVATGEITGTITGGTFHSLIAGNASMVTKGRFDGHEYLDSTSGKTVVERLIKLDVSNGKSQLLVGGSYVDSNVTGVAGLSDSIIRHAVSIDDTDINITGGEHGQITSGSYIGGMVAFSEADGEGYLVTQGKLSLSITGNTRITGDKISAAGFIEEPGVIALVTSQDVLDAVGTIEVNYNDTLAESKNMWTTAPAAGAPAAEVSAYFESITTSGMPPAAYPLPEVPTEGSVVLPLTVETESTHLELGDETTFSTNTIISGDLLNIASTNRVEGGAGLGDISEELNQYFAGAIINPLIEERDAFIEEYGTYAGAQEVIDWFNAWISGAESERDALIAVVAFDTPLSGTLEKSLVKGTRQLELNGDNYAHIDKVTFVEFDEIKTGRGAVVDFSVNNQDLDLFAGRNLLAEGATHVSASESGDILMTGTNTLRKTGAGTLKLGATNGQVGTADDLQLVIESGKVVLAANSAATSQSDFKKIIVQEGTTLDMSEGSNTLGTAAGINGDLHLEGGATLIADALRSAAGSGTSMTGGSLSLEVDAKFMLTLKNIESVEINLNNVRTFTLDTSGASYRLGAFEIVLFSNLDFDTAVNSGFSFLDGTWGGVDARIALASEYMNSNFSLGNYDDVWDNSDVFLVWRENGDLLLTSGFVFLIPEPSTATLSLLALTGLLLRRRRQAR